MTAHTTRKGSPVIRISLPYLIGLANAIEPLSAIKLGDERFSAVLAIWSAQSGLHTFLNGSVFAPEIRSSRLLGEALLVTLGNFDTTNYEKAINHAEAFSVTHGYSQFKTALLAELGITPTYFVSQKGSHNTLSLLDDPRGLYPADLISKVPESLFDVSEAGKALAFELATACGFHVFRATESVIRRYYTEVTGGSPAPKVRNIGVYVHAMRQAKCGNEIVLASIKQMADLHRNPLIHPEAALTLDEAMAILGISRSVVTAMLAELPVLPPTTTTAFPSVTTDTA